MSKQNRTSVIRLQADPKGQRADLYLMGVIGYDWWDGVDNTAQRVLNELQAMQDVTEITVHLATVGGTFYDGIPIYNLLKQHPANVTVNIIGYALSMGSVIMLAGNTIRASENAQIMIHNAQGGAYGSQHDLRQAAEMLANHDQSIVPMFARRMGKTNAEVQALLDKTTWFTAQTALEAGLIDEITGAEDLDKIDNQLPANAWKFAAEHYPDMPEPFAARCQQALAGQAPLLQRILNRMVGKPPAPTTPPEPDNEEANTMTEDQKQELLAAINALKADDSPTAQQLKDAQAKLASADTIEAALRNQLTAKDAELQAKDEELAKVKAELAKLKETDPPTEVPENTGPAGGDWKYKF